MQPEQRRILYIVIIAIVVILAVTLGLVFGLRKSDDEEQPNTKPEVDVMNSYDNTAELIKKFPVINNTTVLSGMEEHIQNRLLTGFENWNRGFKT